MNSMEIPELGAVETVVSAPVIERKQTIICESFSDDYFNVAVSSCRRSVKGVDGFFGYCFLNHPKLQKNQILKWSLRVPKFKYYCGVGMVIILE